LRECNHQESERETLGDSYLHELGYFRTWKNRLPQRHRVTEKTLGNSADRWQNWSAAPLRNKQVPRAGKKALGMTRSKQSTALAAGMAKFWPHLSIMAGAYAAVPC
jgi:hypothetical protein